MEDIDYSLFKKLSSIWAELGLTIQEQKKKLETLVNTEQKYLDEAKTKVNVLLQQEKTISEELGCASMKPNSSQPLYKLYDSLKSRCSELEQVKPSHITLLTC